MAPNASRVIVASIFADGWGRSVEREKQSAGPHVAACDGALKKLRVLRRPLEFVT